MFDRSSAYRANPWIHVWLLLVENADLVAAYLVKLILLSANLVEDKPLNSRHYN